MSIKITQVIVKVNTIDKYHYKWTKLEIVDAPHSALFFHKSDSDMRLIEKCCDNIARSKARKITKKVGSLTTDEVAFSTEKLSYTLDRGWDAKF